MIEQKLHWAKRPLPHVGMRIIKTAVAMMICYSIFAMFGFTYQEDIPGIRGQLGPLYACIACLISTQSTLGQTFRQGVNRIIGVAVGGGISIALLLLGDALTNTWVTMVAIGFSCVAGMWLCLLLKVPGSAPMACILPCVILGAGVEIEVRHYYAVARLIETMVGMGIAVLVNAILPDRRPELEKRKSDIMKVSLYNSTKKLCVIGDPIGHSKSPLIHNTMINAKGLNYLYLCQPVPRGEVAQWLELAKFGGYAGFNATMPHKEELVPLMDGLSDDAKLYGAVNTVCIKDGKAYGHNTDGMGFLRALEEEGHSVKGARVMILGAGGAAKAVALKLAEEGAIRVTICNRTLERSQALCALDCHGILEPALFTSEVLTKIAGESDLLVNCTSIGMDGMVAQFQDFAFLAALPPEAVVCDLIYNPKKTELLQKAKKLGHPTFNGLGMLIHQAILALELFTGERLDPEVMVPKVRDALQNPPPEKE